VPAPAATRAVTQSVAIQTEQSVAAALDGKEFGAADEMIAGMRPQTRRAALSAEALTEAEAANDPSVWRRRTATT
jgi:hypothetical protein